MSSYFTLNLHVLVTYGCDKHLDDLWLPSRYLGTISIFHRDVEPIWMISHYKFQWATTAIIVDFLIMYSQHFQQRMDQPVMVANLARGDLNRKKRFFPVLVRA